jgi:hypothetical protein
MACMSISVNCHFVTYSLHILLSPAIFMDTNHSLSWPIYQDLPYDKAAMRVKRIDAFRIGAQWEE